MIEMLFKLILCHVVGDYFFQTRFIAETKGKNWYHLFDQSAAQETQDKKRKR